MIVNKTLIIEALELGLASAQVEANEYHRTMAGYRQAQHDALDADVETIKDAIEYVSNI
jgi:hypothetical protein